MRQVAGQHFGRIAFWSVLSNAVLADLFIMAASLQQMETYFTHDPQSRVTIVAKTYDPLAVTRMRKSDIEANSGSVLTAGKSSLGLARKIAPDNYDATRQAALSEVDVEPETDSASAEVVAARFEDVSAVDDVQGMRVSPLLRTNKETGNLEIGNFKSLSFAGDVAACLDMGTSMLDDVNITGERLEVLTSSALITVAKICAANGTVILSCRNDQITISSRRPRPDDNCVR